MQCFTVCYSLHELLCWMEIAWWETCMASAKQKYRNKYRNTENSESWLGRVQSCLPGLIHIDLLDYLPVPYIHFFKTTYGKGEIFRYQVRRLHRPFGGERISLISFCTYQTGSSSEKGLYLKCPVQWHPRCKLCK